MRSFYKRKRLIILSAIILIIAALVTFIISCMVGSSGLGAAKAMRAILSALPFGERDSVPEYWRKIIFDIRMPRALMALLVGGTLAIAGSALQGLFKNPLVDSGILGVSSGAGLGAAIAIVAGITFKNSSVGLLLLGAFAGGLTGVMLVYFLAVQKGRVSSVRLLLSGIAVGSLFSALTSAVMILNRDSLERVVGWTMGSFTAVGWNEILWTAPIMLIGSVLLVLDARKLNIMLLGEDEAMHLGINTAMLRKRIVFLSAAVTAAAVSAVGIIGFVGLMIPHSVRILSGPDHRTLMPFSFIAGGIFMMLADIIARMLIAPLEVPVGVITAIIGGLFFLYLLKIRRV